LDALIDQKWLENIRGTGCCAQALHNIPKDKGVDVMMLPEFIDKVDRGV
jgi:hypothetical protein